MTDHVIECRWESHRCICEELRACEQRVYDERNEAWVKKCRASERHALDAAREAVAAVPPIDQRVDDNGLVSLVYDKGEALAAIDALKKNNET